MKKPWEQDWTTHQEGPSIAPRVVGPDGDVAKMVVRYKDDGRWSTPQFAQAWEEAALLAAAPDMARALLAVMQQTVNGVHHTDECMQADTLDCLPSCIAGREALKKAGVLL